MLFMTKLEKLYSIIENSRDVGVKLPKGVLQQVEELEEEIYYYKHNYWG
jgi:phage-related holin